MKCLGIYPRIKPAFHGACFGAVSAPILSARVPRRASAAFEKEHFHCRRRQSMLPEALIVRLSVRKTLGNSHFSWRLALLFDAQTVCVVETDCLRCYY